MWARVGARIGPISGALTARVPFDELQQVSSATCNHLVEQRTGLGVVTYRRIAYSMASVSHRILI